VAGINKWKLILLAALAVIVLVLPQVVKSSFAIDIFIRILLFSFIGVAWNLMGGYAKQLSLGHAAYFGLGAYTSTIMQVDFGISPWIGMVAGGIVAMLASLPIGWLCFRLRGPYFTIATIATAQALMLIFLTFALSLLLLNLALMLFTANYRTVHTSYSDEAFHLAGLYIPVAKLIAFVVAMGLSAALWVFLHTTDLGKAMRAAAQNRDVATLMGINPNRVFCVALGVALALIVSFIFTGFPVGLGATLIVAGLVLRRAGPWWRREPSQALAEAGAA